MKTFSQLEMFYQISVASVLMLISVSVCGAGFNDNGDGTVTDFATGLTWQQSDAQNSTTRNWVAAETYCDGLSLTEKSDWRLPEVKELSGIIDTRRSSPATDITAFPGTLWLGYWTATNYSVNHSLVWVVGFDTGPVDYYVKTNVYNVRCVR